MPLDAYEELVDGDISLRDLEDWTGDNKREPSVLDDFSFEPETKKDLPSTAPATDEEIQKLVEHDLEIIKAAEQSQKDIETPGSMDVLDDEANEDQYYLEPLE
jgi:hypothetical protein